MAFRNKPLGPDFMMHVHTVGIYLLGDNLWIFFLYFLSFGSLHFHSMVIPRLRRAHAQQRSLTAAVSANAFWPVFGGMA